MADGPAPQTHQHDADLMTFHRIQDFRSLALDIFPRA